MRARSIIQLRTAYSLQREYTLGHSLETFPEEMAAVRDAGHEMWVFICVLMLDLASNVTSVQRAARVFTRGSYYWMVWPILPEWLSSSVEPVFHDARAAKGHTGPYVRALDSV